MYIDDVDDVDVNDDVVDGDDDDRYSAAHLYIRLMVRGIEQIDFLGGISQLSELYMYQNDITLEEEYRSSNVIR